MLCYIDVVLPGRVYEHVGLVIGLESLHVVMFLVTIPQSPPVKRAVDGAIQWFVSSEVILEGCVNAGVRPCIFCDARMSLYAYFRESLSESSCRCSSKRMHFSQGISPVPTYFTNDYL